MDAKLRVARLSAGVILSDEECCDEDMKNN